MQLVDAMSTRSGLTKADTLKALDAFIDVVETAVAKQETISLIGFLVISVRKRLARMGRNLQTKEIVQIPETTVPVFKAGKRLKNAAMGKLSIPEEALA